MGHHDSARRDADITFRLSKCPGPSSLVQKQMQRRSYIMLGSYLKRNLHVESCSLRLYEWFGINEGRLKVKGLKGAKRWKRDDRICWEAIPECPCMYFGSNVVVSCLHADAACLKMDMRVCVCVPLCVNAEAAYPQMDVETVVSLRRERHLEETLQGTTCSWIDPDKVNSCWLLTSWQCANKSLLS